MMSGASANPPIAYGAALNERRALFPSDEQFGRWVADVVSDNLSVTPNDHKRAAAMPSLASGYAFPTWISASPVGGKSATVADPRSEYTSNIHEPCEQGSVMTVIKTDNGAWLVVDSGQTVAGPFDTMADVWRWVDRHTGEPISKAEERSEWIADRILKGGAS